MGNINSDRKEASKIDLARLGNFGKIPNKSMIANSLIKRAAVKSIKTYYLFFHIALAFYSCCLNTM